MSKRSEIEETVEKLLEPIAERHSVRIYDVEYTTSGGENALCAYIDKDGGVTIDDCVDVSHDLSDILDEKDPISEAYTLYVSSPGLGRALTKDRHFAASIGQEVEGTTFRAFLTPEELEKQETAERESLSASVPSESAGTPGDTVSTSESDSAAGDGSSSGSSGKTKKKSGSGKRKAKPAGGKGSRNFEGVLKAFDADTVTIGRKSPKGKELKDLVLERKNIAKIRLKIDF